MIQKLPAALHLSQSSVVHDSYFANRKNSYKICLESILAFFFFSEVYRGRKLMH